MQVSPTPISGHEKIEWSPYIIILSSKKMKG